MGQGGNGVERYTALGCWSTRLICSGRCNIGHEQIYCTPYSDWHAGTGETIGVVLSSTVAFYKDEPIDNKATVARSLPRLWVSQ